MTHRARPTKREDFRGELLELLGLTLTVGVFVLFVVRPEIGQALVHTFATTTAGLAH